MSACLQLSDRMASVAQGRSAWSPAESGHLASCPDCAAEWRVLQAGARIGAHVAETLPVDFLATRVVAAVGGAARRRSWWLRLRWVTVPAAAAAAIALVVLPGGERAWSGGSSPGVAEVSLLPELDPLDASDLELVMELLPGPAEPVEIRSFEELTDDEVTRLLNSLEG
jgi:hypothetical protein